MNRSDVSKLFACSMLATVLVQDVCAQVTATIRWRNQGITDCLNPVNQTLTFSNGQAISLSAVLTGNQMNALGGIQGGGVFPPCNTSFYYMESVVISNSASSPNIGPISINGTGVLITGQTIGVGINPVVDGQVAGLSIGNSGGFSFSIAGGLNTTRTFNVAGIISVSSMGATLRTAGTLTSAGQVSVTSAPNDSLFEFASIDARADGQPSVRITNAGSNVTVATTTGNLNGNIVVTNAPTTTPSVAVVANTGNIGGNIEVVNGELTAVRAVLGNIVNPAEFSAGQSWATTPPSDEFAGRLSIKSKSRIREIRAQRIAANIDADSDNLAGGQIDRIEASNTSATGGPGLYGTVKASRLFREASPTQPAVSVAGVLQSAITLTGTGAVDSPLAVNQFSSVSTFGAVAAPVSITGSASSGSLVLGNIAASGSLNVAGDVNIPITIASTASGSNLNFTGSIPAGRTVRINGTHAGTITTGSTGSPNLAGQVIINSLNNASDWTGVAKVGGSVGTTLSPVRFYDNAPSVLGGGAVGLAPFAMHASGGLPVQDRLWSPVPVGTLASPTTSDWNGVLKVTGDQFVVDTTTVPPVRMRFYGPVSAVGSTECWGTRPPFKVERSATPDFASVVDVSHLFGWSQQQNNRELLLQNSALVTSCGLKRGYYRVSPATTPGIKTAGGVTGSPNVRDFRFYFRLDDSTCNMKADVAGPNQSVGPDDLLTADDIIVFLGWYFANDLRADVAGPDQSTTPDGVLTADDIIVFLGRYFAGCNLTACPDNPPACSEEEGGIGGGGEGMMVAPSNAQAAAPQDPALALVQMIALESDPAKRSMLEFALGIVLGNASIGSSSSDR